MVDEKKLKNATKVYNTLCDMLKEKNMKFERHDDDLVVTLIMSGDDFPMQLILKVDAKRELVGLYSPMPVIFDESKRIDAALATCYTNYRLADGSFDFNYREGKILFRLTSSFIDSIISKELLEYMISVSCYTIDDFNDKFFMLAKGQLPVETFLKQD